MRIAINGKFLGAPLNGVHRTAALYTRGLLERRSRDVDIEVLAPRQPPPDGVDADAVLVNEGRCGTGQGWEMLTLPRLARGRLLLSFCNMAPLLHDNSVVMIHDAQTFLHPRDYTLRQAAAYRALLPLVGRRARRVLTVSEFSRRSLVEHGIAAEQKIRVVHNGTDHLLDTPADEAVLERLRLESGAYAMVLGSSKGYKNIARVFDVFAEPPLGLSLVVAGGPDPGAYDSRHGAIPDRTVFTGRIDDAALRALYEHAFVFLFPSLTEGFGLPPVEAMHCGTPVVAARAGAVEEVCEGAAALVDPDDTDGWRLAIESLDDDRRRGALVEAGASRAATLTWKLANERLWEGIQDLLT